jgi:hypothetical protein
MISMKKLGWIITVAVFSMNVSVFAGQAVIRLEEPVGLDRANWPVGLGFPFARGELKDLSSLVVFSPAGEPLPVQAKVLNRWPDGSIRWAHVFFLADLKSQAIADWRLEWNAGARAAVPARKVQVEERSGSIKVIAAGLEVIFSAAGGRIFESVKVEGREILEASRRSGFSIETPDGKVFVAPAAKGVKFTIEEKGPLRAIVRSEGKHVSTAGDTLFDYVCRFIFYAGAPWFEVEHSFVNRESAEWTDIAAITFIAASRPERHSLSWAHLGI